MAQRGLQALFGGIGDFVTNQRTFTEQDAERKRQQEQHALAKALTEQKIAQETFTTKNQGRAFNTDLASKEAEFLGEVTPETQNQLTSTTTDPAQRAVYSNAFGRLGKKADLGLRRATADTSSAESTSSVNSILADQTKQNQILRQNILADPNFYGDPLTNDKAARYFKLAGIPVEDTVAETHRKAMELAKQSGANAIAAIQARAQADNAAMDRMLLPGTQPNTDGMVRSNLDAFRKSTAALAEDLNQIDRVIYAQQARLREQRNRTKTNQPLVDDFIKQQLLAREVILKRARADGAAISTGATSLGITNEQTHQFIKGQVQASLAGLPAAPSEVALAAGTATPGAAAATRPGVKNPDGTVDVDIR